jgi:hypothetical protein
VAAKHRAPPWLRGLSGQAGGPRPLALRPRPGEPSRPPLLAERHHTRDHEEHLSNLNLVPIGEWRTAPCTRPPKTETLRKSMCGAPSRSRFALALASEIATSATSSRLWRTSPISLAKLDGLPEPRSQPVVGRRSCRMAPMLPDGSPPKTGIALPTFRGESHNCSSSRSVSPPPFHARRCCALLGGVCGGRYAEYARTLQTPFLVGHSGVLKSFFWGRCPLGPRRIPSVGNGLGVPVRGYR